MDLHSVTTLNVLVELISGHVSDALYAMADGRTTTQCIIEARITVTLASFVFGKYGEQSLMAQQGND